MAWKNFQLKAISFCLIVLSFFFWNSSKVNAQEEPECDPAEIDLIFRDSSGDWIPNINFKIYEQGEDADGEDVPLTNKVAGSGRTSATTGIGEASFTPSNESSLTYVVQAYDKNANVGAFWFLNAFTASCGSVITFEKTLSSIEFIFRDGNGELKKNVPFSVYTQRYDVENNPIYEKKDLVASLNTGEVGGATIFVTDSHHTLSEMGGDYVASADLGGNIGYVEKYIHVYESQNTVFEYNISDIRLMAENAAGDLMPSKKTLELFEQLADVKGNPILGKSLKKITFNTVGEVIIEYPAGTYAVVIKDDFDKSMVFWNVVIEKGQRVEKTLVTSLVRADAKENNQMFVQGKKINIYELTRDYKGRYYRDKKLGTLTIDARGYAETSLAPGKYLFTVSSNDRNIKGEFGQMVFISAGKLHRLTLRVDPSTLIVLNNSMIVPKISALAEKLKGYILLQVEERGEAWYVDVKNKERIYLKDGVTAYELMRKVGVGITNENLNKIPIGLDSRLSGDDSDGDGLLDKLEEALGTDTLSSDTDQDGYLDGDEIRNGYNPLADSSVKTATDQALVGSARGKILLQVESRGEAWYLNPKDGKRYYMPDGQSAYSLMRFMGLGISNADLETINETILE